MSCIACENCSKMVDSDVDDECFCEDCGAATCKKHRVFAPTATAMYLGLSDKVLCFECGKERAERESKADAPGVWPDWAKNIPHDSPKVKEVKVVIKRPKNTGLQTSPLKWA